MSTNVLLHLERVDLFNDSVKVELLETTQSTAASQTRLKLYKNNSVFNIIHKDFRSEWFGGGKAELVWYDQYASQINPPISPKFFGGGMNPPTRQCHLFLEDLSETHYQVPETQPANTIQLEAFEQAVDNLLQLHTHWWDHQHLKDNVFVSPQGGPLRLAQATTSENIGRYVHSLHQALPNLIDSIEPKMPPHWITIYEQAIQSWERLLTERIADEENLTLLHGDFHIGNIFLPKQPESKGALVVDWETYKRGFGVYDLAYLMVTGLAVSLRREKEQDFLRNYHNGLRKSGIEQYSWQDCLQDYRLAIIANLFPPLMWRSSEKMKRAISAFAEWHCLELLK